MRVILKILAAPFVVILTPTVAILTFLFCYAVTVLNIISGIGVLLGVVSIIAQQTVNGCIILFLAFLLSPLGLPAIAEQLLVKLACVNYSLRDFITS